MRKLFSARSACFAALAAFCTAPLPATAAETVSFAGKRVEIIVPFSPGGGTDVYVRALAPYLEKHLPGKPTVIVRNIPGARGIPGANQFQARAKPDGTDVIAGSASNVATFVLERSKVEYKLNEWEPIVLSPQGAVVYASPSLGVTGPKDLPKLKGKQLVFGGQSPGSAELRVIVTFELLGLKPNYVWGLNRGPLRLAFERGEMNINYDSTPGFLKNAMQLVKAGKAVPLYSLGVLDEKGALVRDPNFPDMPNFADAYELMHGKKPSGQGFDAWLSVMKMLVMLNKGLYLPAGTPKPVLDAWRTAIKKVLDDPDFQKKAGHIIEGYPQFVGEAARPIIKDATTFSPASWAWIKNYLKTEHNVTIQ
jgi:tripartite-type tricarboxylate transporter receptor subunit TctC